MVIEPRSLARRWIAFGSVGALGFGVQFATLVLLTGWMEANYLLATAIAVELAILNNFFWHQRWTWSDRGGGGAGRVVARLLRYNAGTALTSIGGNLALMWVFVSWFEIHYAIANVLSVLALSIANFLYCDRLVFSRGPNAPGGTVTSTMGAEGDRGDHFSSGKAARTVAGSIICESTTMPTAAASIGAATTGCSTAMSAAPPRRIRA